MWYNFCLRIWQGVKLLINIRDILVKHIIWNRVPYWIIQKYAHVLIISFTSSVVFKKNRRAMIAAAIGCLIKASWTNLMEYA